MKVMGSQLMQVEIVERYSPCGIDVGRIVRRIIRHAPPNSVADLQRIVLADKNPGDLAFGCYHKESRQIELYVQSIVGDLPWALKKSYLIPYLFIGLALGHEIDHHVTRGSTARDRELSANANAMKYVYPSFGFLKPVYRLFASLVKSIKR